MRFWVEKNNNIVYLKFQPDTQLESIILDELLGFDWKQTSIPISGERDKKVEDGASQTATLDGHESQRTIVVEL